jgi:hypothetical protein
VSRKLERFCTEELNKILWIDNFQAIEKAEHLRDCLSALFAPPRDDLPLRRNNR